MATYLQAVTISLPNAALLRIEGTMSMADEEVGWIFTSHIERHHHDDGGLACGSLRPQAIFQLSIAIFAFRLVLTTRVPTIAPEGALPIRSAWP